MEKGQFTREEIFTQHDAWVGALREVEERKKQICDIDFGNYRQIIFTGCGSTYYLALAAASVFQSQTGLFCVAVPGSELLLNPWAVYSGNDNLLFAISRSGSTSETVNAVKQFKDNQSGRVVSISTYHDRPLSEISDLALCIQEGQEQSIAQTRAFCSMYITAVAVAVVSSGKKDLFEEMKKLPDIGKALIQKNHDYAKQIGENLEFDRFYFLGSGHRYGIACEASLKMKEMTITHTEPFYCLEFRHGPISMVNDKTVVLGLLSDSWREYEEKVLGDTQELGACVVTLAENDADISFESKLTESIRNVLYLPMLQVMAFYRSIKKGIDPDKPKNLSAVVYLE